ncbi:DUF4259 domain-containing protein [Streptomyces yangpuensis]|uniref:DUF4259 domain-containing protein n=1 Tax=Streptomyces yangpuensis TaxID=1648182 RepID=UPI003829E68D
MTQQLRLTLDQPVRRDVKVESMGTWGAGPFEDDSALDFVDHLCTLPAHEVAVELERAVRSVAEEEEYIEYSAGVSAVAAATLLSGQYRDHLQEWPAPAGIPALTPELAELALRAIERAHSDGSHLWELWTESGKYGEVWKSLAPVQAGLLGAANPAQPDSLF